MGFSALNPHTFKQTLKNTVEKSQYDLMSVIHMLILKNCNDAILFQVSTVTVEIYNILTPRQELPLQLYFSVTEIQSITV